MSSFNFKRNKYHVTRIFCLVFILKCISFVGAKDFPEVELHNTFKENKSLSNVHAHNKVVVCYVGTWSTYRPAEGAYDLLDKFNPQLCTHLIYSFAGLDNGSFTIKSLDAYLDLEENYGKGWFKKVTGLKQRYSHLRVLLAIGGWNEGSEKYSVMAMDPSKRDKFINSVVDMLRKYGFDGLDLDWEFPSSRGGKPEDKQNFVKLVSELRHKFDKYGYLLTAAFGASQEIAEQAYDLRELSQLLDHIHIMCYDYYGSWNNFAYHNAPLFAPKGNLSVQASVDYYLSQGVIPEKLVLGLPLYGRTFLLRDDVINETGSALQAAALNKGFQGPYTREDGFLGYNEICIELSTNRGHWKTYWDDEAKVPYMRHSAGSKWVSFDNPDSLHQKIEFALSRGLKGAMVWSIDTDDFMSTCGGSKYPLLQSINYALAVESKKKKTPSKGKDKTKPSSAGSDSNIKINFLSSSIAMIFVTATVIKMNDIFNS